MNRIYAIALERAIGMLTDTQIDEQIAAISASQATFEALPYDDPVKNYADPERVGASDLLLDYLREEQYQREEAQEWARFWADMDAEEKK